ncbi:MAG: OmpA family protein [Saprospiraceae bacterium]|nr:OmpA family protein [Saprospiraceae bacterium]
MIFRIKFFLFFTVICIQITAQNEYLLKADLAFDLGRYEKAIDYYSNYPEINNDVDALTKRGVSYFNYNLLNNAIKDFTSAKKLGSASPLLYLKMAQSKQHLNAFDEAAFFYKQFLDQSKKSSPYYKLAEIELKNCVFSSFNSTKRTGSLVQSFGEEVNSQFDEINAIQSPNFGNLFYFSTNRNKSDFDIYAYVLSEDGVWSTYDLTEKPFNNGYNNIALDIDSGKGNALLFQENRMSQQLTRFAGFDEEGNDILITLPQEIFEDAIDITIVNHNVLVFSSNKFDGYGGYDIYSITFANGQWGAPSNLGSAINSSFDERSPFYSNNMEHFYFSSNRPYSFGGFDIYYCDIKNKNEPQNMGNGINSSGNEINFNIDAAGHMAMFSSDRKTGLGGYDLYFAYLQDVKNMGLRDSITFEFIDYHKEQFVKKVGQKEEVVVINVENKDTIRDTKVIDVIEKDTSLITENLPEKSVIDTIATSQVEDRTTTETKLKDLKDTLEKEAEIVKKDTLVVEAKEPKEVVHVEDNVSDTSSNFVAEEKLPIQTPINPDTIIDLAPIDSLEQNNPLELDTKKETIPVSKTKNNFANPFTLLYVDRQDLTTGINKLKLDDIINVLKESDKSILISSHTDHHEMGLPEYVQYNTLKRALSVADYILKNGVSDEQISILSVAHNYPLVKKDINGIEVDSIIKWNKRIEIQIYDDEQIVLEDNLLEDKSIPPFALDPKFEIYSSIRDGIYYSVEIAGSKRIFKNAILRLYNDIYIRRESFDANNKYYIGIYTKKEDAEALQKELSKSSAPYAKVVAFKNGKRLN